MNHRRFFVFMAAIWILSAIAFGQTLTVVSPNGGERWNTGDPVNITWTSSGVSGDLRINLYRSSGVLVGAIANAVPVAAGSYSWSAGRLMVGMAEYGEDYMVRLRMIGADTMDSSDAPFTLIAPLPNIRCESMCEIGWDYTFVPQLFIAGDTVTVRYHLRNDSERPAGPFQVGLRVGGAIVARNAHGGLVSGGEDHGEFAWTAVCGSAVAVVADCDNEVTENNEGDNVMTDSGLACSQPDLYFFRALACSGSLPVKAGVRYNFSAQLKSAAVRAENVRVVGGVVDGAVLYDHTFPALAGDSSLEDVAFVWEVPEGSHRVYFEADPDRLVAESNEGNNRTELAVTAVASTPAEETYDLSLRLTSPRRPFAPRTTAVEVTQGKPLTISGEVRGATGAIRDFKVTATLLAKGALPAVLYERNFNDPGMLVVPFSFTWTPSALGNCSLKVQASLGPHALGAGVVDSAPGNNTVKLDFEVVKSKPTLRR